MIATHRYRASGPPGPGRSAVTPRRNLRARPPVGRAGCVADLPGKAVYPSRRVCNARSRGLVRYRIGSAGSALPLFYRAVVKSFVGGASAPMPFAPIAP
ncbi:hypothetical protein LG3211_2334 [Lysobacter gummosus]|nr:hypothetical protein LG3211_2334 [Lysobacter gummosus]